MTELKFAASFIICTPGADEPFELVLDDKYQGYQQLSTLEAKQIADFIYEGLGISDKLFETLENVIDVLIEEGNGTTSKDIHLAANTLMDLIDDVLRG